MEYSIYKDSKVEDTVERIKNILRDLEIELREDVYNFRIQDKKMPCSLSLKLFGRLAETNGKGSCFANARASAYSEFMERLQNNLSNNLEFNSDNFIFAPDEQYIKFSDDNILKEYYGKDFVEYLYKLTYNDINQIYTLPFYSLREKKTVNIPVELLISLQTSSGMCAGNTPQEAIVQGLSEIYERYSKKKIILDNISMPDIPEEVWGKYERIKELKEYIEMYGYTVHIKDASLGKKIPVACTIYENKEEGFFGFNFGAQPSLPIAIERTLTEFMQGGIPTFRDIKLDIRDDVSFIDRNYLLEAACLSSCALIKNNQDKTLYEQFFLNTPDYEFSKSTWIDENKTYTNKELLEFLITNSDVLQNKKIYIRDVSFLNYPSYYIYIPTVSEWIEKDLERIKAIYNFTKWIFYEYDKYPENQDIDSLISAIKFKLEYMDYSTKDEFISLLANEYLLLLCFIIKNDIDNIIKYCNIIINSAHIRKNNNNFELMKKYFEIKNNGENPTTILKEKYTSDEINDFEMFISNISFDWLKNLIRDTNKRYFEIKNRQNKQPEINASDDNEWSIDYRLSRVKYKIANKYVENIPNQMDLSQVFNFV